jgi:hypothetical protein
MFRAIFMSIGLMASSIIPVFADDFCRGFERGYVAGYMRAANVPLEPLAPLCPLQPMKSFSDPASDVEHGYIIGLERGMIEGRKR